MIWINAPVEQPFVISLLDGRTINGNTYKYAGKKGSLKLLFECSGENDPVQTAKQAIKDTQIGSVLYFQIGEER